MDKQDLIPLVERVAELRGCSEVMIKNRDLLKQKLMQTPQGMDYEMTCENIGKLSEDLMMAERELKERSIALYQTTGEKKPIDKVEIKIFKRLKYDASKILNWCNWCKENAPSLLIVNKKPFEKTAEAIGAPVEVIEEAKCTIGTDLSAYIKTKEEVKTDD